MSDKIKLFIQCDCPFIPCPHNPDEETKPPEKTEEVYFSSDQMFDFGKQQGWWVGFIQGGVFGWCMRWLVVYLFDLWGRARS